MPHKSRKQKASEYEEKYGDIPVDFRQRMSWLYDTLKLSQSQIYEIMTTSSQMSGALQFSGDINVVLFEVPEGSPRPRFRIVNRQNLANMAIANPSFVHVYSITGSEDNKFMRRLVDAGELQQLDSLICTPCNVDICAYMRTPTSFNKTDTILAEMGLIRPIYKPDFDNIAKKYSDMFNKNVWLDDTLVIDGSIHKYYSVLPRIEIRIRYLNMLYNRSQYNSITNRVDYDGSTDLSYFQKKG